MYCAFCPQKMDASQRRALARHVWLSAFCLRLLKKLMPRAIMHSIMQETVCFLKISRRGIFCYKDERYSLQETASDDNGLPQDMSGESFVMELYGRQ